MCFCLKVSYKPAVGVSAGTVALCGSPPPGPHPSLFTRLSAGFGSSRATTRGASFFSAFWLEALLRSLPCGPLHRAAHNGAGGSRLREQTGGPPRREAAPVASFQKQHPVTSAGVADCAALGSNTRRRDHRGPPPPHCCALPAAPRPAGVGLPGAGNAVRRVLFLCFPVLEYSAWNCYLVR